MYGLNSGLLKTTLEPGLKYRICNLQDLLNDIENVYLLLYGTNSL